MAAPLTVPQHSQQRNFMPIKPQHGVIMLFGYGIKAQVDRGHLVIEDGIGPERRRACLPRIGHGLRRLVVIGSDGMVTLAALRWLADQDASFVMLNRDGSVLATTGPVRSSDARLRRAQSLAHQTGAAMQIGRGLISQKLDGQERIVRDTLQDSVIADKIAFSEPNWGEPRQLRRFDSLNHKRHRLIGSRGAVCQSIFQRLITVEYPNTGVPSALVNRS
jgi:hypothetical protein